MEQTRSYRPLCLSLYLNYFVHGIGVLILAQNMDSLAALGQFSRRHERHRHARYRPTHRSFRIGQIIRQIRS